MRADVTVLPNDTALANAAAERFAAIVTARVGEDGFATVALAGGDTPRRLYQRLAQEPYCSTLPWQRVQIFFGDERCVPPDHPESNYRMAEETLLSRVPVPAAQVHRMRGELPPREAAEQYASTLHAVFATLGNGVWPRFDLVLLGMGADGHTASLFPHTTALAVTDRVATEVYVPKLERWRLTLTLPVLNAARHVLFLVAGEAKRAAVRRVLDGSAPPAPAALVRPTAGAVYWLLDAAASGNFPREAE